MNSRCFHLSTGAVGNVLIGVSVSFYALSIGPLGPNEIHWLKNAITIGIFYIVIFLNPYLLKYISRITKANCDFKKNY